MGDLSRREALKRLALLGAGYAAGGKIPRFALEQRLASAPQALSAADEDFLDDLERAGVSFFWEQASPASGLIRDRSRADGSPPAVAMSPVSPPPASA